MTIERGDLDRGEVDLEAHPRLTKEGVLAALRFAARVRRTGAPGDISC